MVKIIICKNSMSITQLKLSGDSNQKKTINFEQVLASIMIKYVVRCMAM